MRRGGMRLHCENLGPRVVQSEHEGKETRELLELRGAGLEAAGT